LTKPIYGFIIIPDAVNFFRRMAMKECNFKEATHVKNPRGQIKKIKSKWGIRTDGSLSKPSEGGFGCTTEDGEVVDMYSAKLYFTDNE
jgi:hypothetical protein